MSGNGGWFRNFMNRIANGLRSFMAGRYGTDQLNTAILLTGVAVCLVAMFIPWAIVKLILTMISYGLMFWAVFRTLSRNTYKRYQENRKFRMLIDRIKDRDHRYYDCPRCRQPVRVPKGKGKIAITCPKCREKFIKKT
jgi:hypothetical protein